jgi:hypothetical protein
MILRFISREKYKNNNKLFFIITVHTTHCRFDFCRAREFVHRNRSVRARDDGINPSVELAVVRPWFRRTCERDIEEERVSDRKQERDRERIAGSGALVDEVRSTGVDRLNRHFVLS